MLSEALRNMEQIRCFHSEYSVLRMTYRALPAGRPSGALPGHLGQPGRGEQETGVNSKHATYDDDDVDDT